MYYIDYIDKVIENFNEPDSDLFIYIERVSEIIKDGIKTAKSSGVKIKYMWLRDKVNKVIETKGYAPLQHIP